MAFLSGLLASTAGAGEGRRDAYKDALAQEANAKSFAQKQKEWEDSQAETKRQFDATYKLNTDKAASDKAAKESRAKVNQALIDNYTARTKGLYGDTAPAKKALELVDARIKSLTSGAALNAAKAEFERLRPQLEHEKVAALNSRNAATIAAAQARTQATIAGALQRAGLNDATRLQIAQMTTDRFFKGISLHEAFDAAKTLAVQHAQNERQRYATAANAAVNGKNPADIFAAIKGADLGDVDTSALTSFMNPGTQQQSTSSGGTQQQDLAPLLAAIAAGKGGGGTNTVYVPGGDNSGIAALVPLLQQIVKMNGGKVEPPAVGGGKVDPRLMGEIQKIKDAGHDPSSEGARAALKQDGFTDAQINAALGGKPSGAKTVSPPKVESQKANVLDSPEAQRLVQMIRSPMLSYQRRLAILQEPEVKRIPGLAEALAKELNEATRPKPPPVKSQATDAERLRTAGY